jgi:hypothetical protein
MPKVSCQSTFTSFAPAAAKHEEIAGMPTALQRLLHLEGEAIDAAAINTRTGMGGPLARSSWRSRASFFS